MSLVRRKRRKKIAVGHVSGMTDLAAQAIDVLKVALIIVDDSGRVQITNPAARTLDVVSGMRVCDQSLQEFIEQAWCDSEPLAAEMSLPIPQGSNATEDFLPVRVSAAALSDGKYLCIQIEDMTEAHRLTQVRRDFVANVSHELKTPVGALQLLAETLLDATDDPIAVEKFAHRVGVESRRLGRLIRGLIELSRLQGGDLRFDFRRVGIDQVMTEVLDRTHFAAEARSIGVQTRVPSALFVWGSQSQLITALTNLVDNAIAYSPEGTQVAVTAQQIGDMVEVSVSDQGIGICAADVSRIFERFYRADPARSRATGGTGLGLSIVKYIVSNHDGRIEVASEVGIGSTFTIRLPFSASNPDMTREES